MTSVLKIANASAFWGDQPDAAARLVEAVPDLDFLTLDYLAELSLSIMASQRAKDPAAGYARDFLEVLQSLAPFYQRGGKTRIVTNAGGLDPAACARACIAQLRAANLPHLRIATITGDDILPTLRATSAAPATSASCNPIGYTNPSGTSELPASCNPIGYTTAPPQAPSPSANAPAPPAACNPIGYTSASVPLEAAGSCNLLGYTMGHGRFANLETGAPISLVADRLAIANAYLGAGAIAAALRAGADIVIAGRVADPSLTVGPCIAAFGWAETDYDRIAGATVAGHLIECGTQVCGGFSTDWLTLPRVDDIGFPIAEVAADGSCVITKPPRTGGAVTHDTVKEQLLYEIGDPGSYLSPDVTVSFLGLRLDELGPDRIRVSGAAGRPPPPTYKVSAAYRDGFKSHGLLTLFGHDAVKKARHAGETLLALLAARGCVFRETLVECLGTGAAARGLASRMSDTHLIETVLRVSVAAETRAPVERFARELASLVTCGPQGVTGYATGRPKVLPIFGYWPCAIDRAAVAPRWEFVT